MNVEELAFVLALAYEKAQGRNPIDATVKRVGYDIISEGPDGKRYIEVKGTASERPIKLTLQEWEVAEQLGDKYWVYIVEIDQENATADIRTIQNPLKNLRYEMEVHFRLLDWRDVDIAQSYRLNVESITKGNQ